MIPALILGPLTVHAANSEQNFIVSGFPGPTALLGFVHALERKLWCHGVTATGTAIILHSAQEALGHSKHQQTDPDKIRNLEGAPIVESFVCRFQVSFVINLKVQDEEAFSRLKASAIAIIMPMLASSQIAGGAIASVGNDRRGHVGINVAVTETEMKAFLRQLGAGWLLLDRRDILESGEDDKLAVLLDAMTLYAEQVPEAGEGVETAFESVTSSKNTKTAKPEKARTFSRQNNKGWIVPLGIGFQAIEQPNPHRQTARGSSADSPHVYAECVTGLGELVMFPGRMPDGAAANAFWRHAHHAESGLYYVTALPALLNSQNSVVQEKNHEDHR